jgi:hypothetical protein
MLHEGAERMSTAIMGLCWPMQMPPTPKAVLISLADQANDHGSCWPSMSGIAERTCFGRTAVIEAIKWLEEAGLLSIEKNGGRTNRYQLDLNRLRQREIEPVRQAYQSGKRTSPTNGHTSPSGGLPPVREADQPVREADPNRQEPSIEPKRKKKPSVSVTVLVEAGFDEATAAEFISHKVGVKAPLTERAWKDHLAESRKAGWSPVAAAEKVMARNWKGFDAKYVSGDRGGGSQSRKETQLETAALMTGATRQHQTGEVIDVTPRILAS